MENENLDKDLLQAIRAGDLEKVKSLVEQGADVNSRDAEGYALDIAASLNFDDIANFLVDNDAIDEESESAGWENYSFGI